MRTTVRPFIDSDADALEALWLEVFSYFEARNEPRKVLRDKIDWDGRVLVAEGGGRVVGGACTATMVIVVGCIAWQFATGSGDWGSVARWWLRQNGS